MSREKIREKWEQKGKETKSEERTLKQIIYLSGITGRHIGWNEFE